MNSLAAGRGLTVKSLVGLYPALLASILLWLPAGNILALELSILPELIVLDERLAAHVQGPEVLWSPTLDYLVVTGYTAAGDPTGTVVPLDGRPALSIPNLASPRVVFAPSGGRLACWQRGGLRQPNAPQFVLSLFDPKVGVCAPVEGIAPFDAAPPIVWLSEPNVIITLRQQGEHTALVIYDPVARRLAPLVVTVAGVGTVLRPAGAPGQAIVGTVGLDGTTEYYVIDARTGVVSIVPEGERATVLSDAAASTVPGASKPSGLIAMCRQDGLFVSAPGQQEARQLLPRGSLGIHSFNVVAPPVWSPTEEHIVYFTRAEDGLADVWLATLGLEEVVCELRYNPGDTPPSIGATVWVCMDLKRDQSGRVIEPNWATLKAQLEVTSSPLQTGEGQVIRARSVGLDADVLKRLTGLSDPPADLRDSRSLRIGPAGTSPQTVLRSFTLPARTGLLAWSQGTAALGQVTAVHVTRRTLLLAVQGNQ